MGALNEVIYTYIGQINADLALLDATGALRAANAAAEIAPRIDNRATQTSLALARARALAAAGQLRAAHEILIELHAGTEPIAAAAAAGVLARLASQAGEPGARDLAQQAVDALDAASYAHLRAEAWLVAVRANLDDAARAERSISALERWAEQSGAARAQLMAHLARAEFFVHFGSAQQWRDAYATATAAAAQNGVPSEVAAVATSFADTLLDHGDTQAAAVEVGRVTRWSEQDFDCAVLEARLYGALGHSEAQQMALARARALAGERSIPVDALRMPIAPDAGAASRSHRPAAAINTARIDPEWSLNGAHGRARRDQAPALCRVHSHRSFHVFNPFLRDGVRAGLLLACSALFTFAAGLLHRSTCSRY